MITRIVQSAQRRARAKRAHIFRRCFALDSRTRILDIGSEDGANIAALLDGSSVVASNVHIADISEAAVRRGGERFGFRPVVISEAGKLPFADGFFDIVYCSSVIEHVTVPKSQVWTLHDGHAFRSQAWTRQREFAAEIERLGKRYFVQTPSRSFPIESHSWLPFVGYLPRPALVPFLRFSNRFWPKATMPDWNLLSIAEMQLLFPGSDILEEKFCGLCKSIMAVKR